MNLGYLVATVILSSYNAWPNQHHLIHLYIQHVQTISTQPTLLHHQDDWFQSQQLSLFFLSSKVNRHIQLVIPICDVQIRRQLQTRLCQLCMRWTVVMNSLDQQSSRCESWTVDSCQLQLVYVTDGHGRVKNVTGLCTMWLLRISSGVGRTVGHVWRWTLMVVVVTSSIIFYVCL